MENGSKKRVAVIAGAGPAGLTAALELLRRGDVVPIVLEADEVVGGRSRTVNINGNRIDIGGHRFFSRNSSIMKWWLDIMPLQDAPAKDELAMDAEYVTRALANPEISDNVMLKRRRLSRIFFLRSFFEYPISPSFATFANLGMWRTLKVIGGFVACKLKRHKIRNLEDFYISRFGKPLYHLFFEGYTRKVWGKHPSQLAADWGSQRIKGLSFSSLLRNALRVKNDDVSQQGVETSLINRFLYPKYGPGQFWERVASMVCEKGGIVSTGSRVKHVNIKDGRVVSVEYAAADGTVNVVECDWFLSSMPLKELLPSLQGIDIPADIMNVVFRLPYRDFITVGILLDCMKSMKGGVSALRDTWIYLQERNIIAGRMQIFNNWSPYMVADYGSNVYIGLEYFCNEGDALWSMDDDGLSAMAMDELVKLGLARREDLLSANIVRMKKAYPAYFGSYSELGKVRGFLNGIDNLLCIGRNGQHRYNNMDHSMMSAMKAVGVIYGTDEKESLWNVNTDEEYNESG